MGRKQTIFLQDEHLTRVRSAFNEFPTECSSTELVRVTGLEMKFVRLALDKLMELGEVKTNGLLKRWCRYRLVEGTVVVTEPPQSESSFQEKNEKVIDCGTDRGTVVIGEIEITKSLDLKPLIELGHKLTEKPKKGISAREALDLWIESDDSVGWVPVGEVRAFMESKNSNLLTEEVLSEIRTSIKVGRISRKTVKDDMNRDHRYLKRL